MFPAAQGYLALDPFLHVGMPARDTIAVKRARLCGGWGGIFPATKPSMRDIERDNASND